MNKNMTWTGTTTSAIPRILFITGCLLAAMIALTPAARAADSSFDGKVIEARLLGTVSSTLLEYARRVEALPRVLDDAQRIGTEASANAAYNRLVWFLGTLQSGWPAESADEAAELQQMIAVYRVMHGRVAAAARSGDGTASAHHAAMAASVVDAIQTSLRRIEDRNYSALYGRAFKIAEVK